MTAIRLIKRMKRDWMCQGRRPSSLCGAAILIATKIHKVSNPNCSTTQICKTVFVCDETIRRRLDEFKQTKVSKLTPEQFERDEKIGEEDVEMDPPAFRKARLRSQSKIFFNGRLKLINKGNGFEIGIAEAKDEVGGRGRCSSRDHQAIFRLNCQEILNGQ